MGDGAPGPPTAEPADPADYPADATQAAQAKPGDDRPHAALPAEALGAPPGPRSVFFKVASGALSGALIVLLFAAIIPKVADFDSVWESVKQTRPSVVVLLFVIAVLIRLLLAEAYAVLAPGLSLWRSLIAREASSAVSNIIPGPSGTASQYVILRSWGVNAEKFASATIAVSVSTDVLIFAAPGLLWVAWTLLGMPAGEGGHDAWVFGLVAVVVSVLSVAVVGAVAKSERAAALVGRLGQASLNPFRRLFGKAPVTTWPDQCVALRRDTIEQLKLCGGRLLACVIGGYVLNGILLVGCIWVCGVTGEQMPFSLGMLLYAVGRLSTVVAITPGGIGVVEIAYTAVYVAVLGDATHDAVVAGVLFYRALTYLLPIVTGALAYVVWRVMRIRERRAAESLAV